MKSYEVTIKEDRITIKRTAEENLSAEQKYNLLMATLIASGFLGFFWLMVTH